MENIKFLIILAYYKRPVMVFNALNSIKNLQYQNWHVDFIDDSGDDSFKETLLTAGLDNSKITYIPTYDTDEIKKSVGGSRHGHFMNESIRNSDADVIVILCDDDALISDGLNKLDKFYTENPTINWSYSFVKYYNPTTGSIETATEDFQKIEKVRLTVSLNIDHGPTAPAGKCDSTQVTFRRSNFTDKNIWYPSPMTAALDFHIYQLMFSNYGECYPTREYVQYKAVFADQLGARQSGETITVE
jgi:glycosyltransferase involved in cell wall biosynthesis